ncbi:staphylocoagulase [Staphylococcus agnetis]|uniref:coagulase domain-containing protein n=1 Tax=Staphylococcus agnetis TaxID=985762 RepID=UPI000E080A3A|nr:coagulase domain-containing protein [Staphylococcus agnetis]SUK17560.1 staphylocoagulase [Staphylococcus agnetis]
MKKKLLVLSASAILASNFVFDNSASAVVSENEFRSSALNVQGKTNWNIPLPSYQDSIHNLILRLSVNEFEGYDQPEYKNAYNIYQQRFLAELDALNKFISEDTREPKYVRKYENKKDSNSGGLTQERYESIYHNLEKNRDDFYYAVYDIENNNDELRRFNSKDQKEALKKVYELEDKALMAARALAFEEYKEDVENLYNKLDIIVGKSYTERSLKLPTNKRLLDEMCDNLETIIDEFFKDIKLARPLSIEPLTAKNQDDERVLNKVWKDAKAAKLDPTLVDPGVKERAEKLEKTKELAKKELEAKVKEQKEKGLLRDKEFSARNYPLYFPHKKLNNNSKEKTSSEKQLVFKEVNEQPKHNQIYTQTITATPQQALKQEKREEIIDSNILPRFNQNNTLKGMEGESSPVTVVSEPAIKATTAPQTKEAHTGFSGSNNNLSGMGGESKEVSFTYDSQPVDFDIITESNEIVLDQHTDIKVSGFTTGESIEDSHVSNEVKK